MSMTSLDGMKDHVQGMLRGIERYNPNNIEPLERYVDMQVREQGYDLEANLALLKLYQFNPTCFALPVAAKILLKALTNLPQSDFVLCKCLLTPENLEQTPLKNIQFLANLLEGCEFKEFWQKAHSPGMSEWVRSVPGFEDAIRKFVCHVIGITYQHIPEDNFCELLGLADENLVNQWIARHNWKSGETGFILISTQDEQIKTRKITEKIDIESVAGIMASSF